MGRKRAINEHGDVRCDGDGIRNGHDGVCAEFAGYFEHASVFGLWVEVWVLLGDV